MKAILTDKEIRQALDQDEDFKSEDCEYYSKLASSFINQKTGHDFASDPEVHPLAKECAMLYVRQAYYGNDGYKKDHDFTLGINSLIEDLQDIARDLHKEG